jgi:tyrosine-protein kinase Etk/Wzc
VVDEEIKYQSILASFRKLNEIVGEYDKKMNLLPTTATDQARLEREKSANEKLYLQVEERYQEAIINEQSVPGNALIIDAGLVPPSPAKPNRLLIVVIGLLLGMGLGVGFAFIKNYLDDTVKTPEDISNRNINILSWIPQIEGMDSGNKDFEFIVAKKPDASASEAYRALRTRIKFSKIDKDSLKTLLVTSPTSQEGKTTTSVNLAGSFAQANFKTIIIDADLRKPRIHSLFGQKRFPGFTDYFFGQASYEEIVRKSEVNNLYFITAGTIPPNPSEILGSSQMESFLEKLKNEYDYIIIDSPPVIAVTDSEILSSLVDGTVLVVSANNTEMELMEKAVQLINHERSSFLGVILNNFTYRSGYGSYYKYYYYYSRPTNGGKKNQVKA